jgi:predicted RNase H-like HicB family nuclease
LFSNEAKKPVIRAFVPSLPGCISKGETKEEALENIKEAIELYLEPVEDDMGFGPNAEITEFGSVIRSALIA